MDESLIATPGWAGHERRLGERRVEPGVPTDERRTGRDRRTPIAISPPLDPTLALGGPPAAGQADKGFRRWAEHDAIPSVAALAGHPVHPMLVPIPIGAFVLTVASDAAYAATHDRFFARASRALTAAGIAGGLAAAVFGAADFVGRPRVRDHASAWLHAGGNVAAVGLSAASLLARARARDRVPAAGVALSVTVGTLLLATGWLGGELSYRHRIGVTTDAPSD